MLVWAVAGSCHSYMTITEQPAEMIFCNILSYLAAAFANGGAFAGYLDRVHAKAPSSFSRPWRCILYGDEIHSGNQLASSTRKRWAIYVSFAEFDILLSKAELWFIVMIQRSDHVSSVAGNIGQCFRKHVQQWLWPPACRNPFSKGPQEIEVALDFWLFPTGRLSAKVHLFQQAG